MMDLTLFSTLLGQNGNKIADIKARLTSVLVGVSSTDYVLLFWDSDCSDVDESRLVSSSHYSEKLFMHELSVFMYIV